MNAETIFCVPHAGRKDSQAMDISLNKDNGRLINRIQGKLNMPWIISVFATGYVSPYFHKDVKYVGRKISLLLQVKNRITARFIGGIEVDRRVVRRLS